MAKKIVNSDIYNISQLVDDVKSAFIPEETDETLAIGTYGYLGALESHRLQTQVQMTGELCNEVFPSRARLSRNIITHAIMTNITDINAVPARMTCYLAIREADILKQFDDNNIFTIDRECPIYIGEYEFHLEYDIKLRKIYIDKKKANTYTAQYDIPDNRDVPNSTINANNQYLSPPVVIMVGGESYIYLTVVLSQVEHHIDSKKLVTSNVVDNKTMTFGFDKQLAYFEVRVRESDQEYYLLPIFEGSAIPDSKSKYYCWYQYIDTDLIRVRFDRRSFMPSLNSTVECLIKTTDGLDGNFKYKEDTYIELQSGKYGYKGITCLLTPISNSEGGKNKKSDKELQALIPKEALSRGSLTTITDLNNYFSMLDSEYGRIVIQKKIDNQIERVYYAYFVAKDHNNDVIPSNTVNIRVGLNDLIKSTISEAEAPRYLLPSGSCFKLGEDGIAYINKDPILDKGYKFTPNPVSRGKVVSTQFAVKVNKNALSKENVSCMVEVDNNPTATHVFPSSEEENDRYRYAESNDESIVEDYMQMGVGKIYNYNAEYITKTDNSFITADDLNLGCFDFIDASYTINGDTKHFSPRVGKPLMIVHSLPAKTKILFNIKRRLNTKAKGIITFTNKFNEYKLNQKRTTKLSKVLSNLGFYNCEIKSAISNNERVKLIEDGEVDGPIYKSSSESVSTMSSKRPFVKKVVDLAAEPPEILPEVNDRNTNEWYWAITSKEERKKDKPFPITVPVYNYNSDEPFILHVVEEETLPPVDERKPNEWYYVVKEREGSEIPMDLIPHAAKSMNHKVHIVSPEELPPAGEERGTMHDWYIVVTDAKAEEKNPTGIRGKEYVIDVVDEIEDSVILTVQIDKDTHEITLTQDLFSIENGISVTEQDNVTDTMFTTYAPILEQDYWPESLVEGDVVYYTFRYKSSSSIYSPTITMKISRGLDYVPFTNTITYPKSVPVQNEPIEIPIDIDRGFLYTNPYAININGFRLYSAFYMMSMNENPYLYFNYINDKSNVQFIGNNVRWTRPFYVEGKTKYTLSVDLTQSVQYDLGLNGGTDPDSTPMVKAVAVFYRDGKPYRYRSLKLTNFDPLSYTYSFAQDFESSDIFDNDNNIKITNTQVVSQMEYKTTLSYNGKKYTIMNGGTASLKDVLVAFGFKNPVPVIAKSNDRSAIDLYPILKDAEIVDYKIRSFTDVDEGTLIHTSLTTSSDLIEIKVTNEELDPSSEYGYFNPNTDVRIYALCSLPDITGKYHRYDFDSICPGLQDWTLTNIFEVVNGVNFYHNYSEIMGSRVKPYGKTLLDPDNNVVMQLEGYEINSVPMLGYDYCQDDILVQDVIDTLNYRKGYIDNAMTVLENSFGIDFKLFNTYGPSNIYYIIKDRDENGLLDDRIEYIDRVNLTLNFRVKLLSANDGYTKNNIMNEVKEYIEDLDDIGQLHIPNLITQITTNYKEQISYFEYLGFNNYGADVQHIYKRTDNEIPIHTAPEFLCINNKIDSNGTMSPDINIFISEI